MSDFANRVGATLLRCPPSALDGEASRHLATAATRSPRFIRRRRRSDRSPSRSPGGTVVPFRRHTGKFVTFYCMGDRKGRPYANHYKATSKNSFLRLWAEDFGSEKVMEKTEYFVYCGFFITHFWGERFAQSPKGEFLEVPCRCGYQLS